jgi:DNA (cytosine-5)-methyltransferase 1
VADADAAGQRLERGGGLLDGERAALRNDADGCCAGELADTDSEDQGRRRIQRPGEGIGAGAGAAQQRSERLRAVSPWSDLVWLPCTDGRQRPTESTLQCLPDGLSNSLGYVCAGEGYVLSPLITGGKNRVGRLRAYGNAIVPALAAEFIKAAMP